MSPSRATVALVAVVAALLAVAQPAAAAAPANDNFADATVLTGASGTLADQTNVEATAETGEPSNHGTDCCPTDDLADSSVWYKWTAPADGLVAFDTFGTENLSGGIDSVLGVYTGSLGSLVEVNSTQGLNDDYGGACCTSRVVLNAVKDTTYSIGVSVCCGTGSGGTGPFDLNWGPATRPANDNFASATTISGATGSLTTESNFDATPESGEPANHLTNNDLGGDSVWYSWTAPVDGPAQLSGTMLTFRGTSTVPAIGVYTGNLASLTEVGYSNSGPVQFDATGGTTYMIGLGGCCDFTNSVYWGDMGDMTLDWTLGDLTPPDTTITSAKGAKHAITVSFTGSDDTSAPGSLTFECKIDSGAFGSCTSPKTFSSITGGAHTISVRAIDEANNVDGSPATVTVKAKGSPKTTT
jgi:hypothetical protein